MVMTVSVSVSLVGAVFSIVCRTRTDRLFGIRHVTLFVSL